MIPTECSITPTFADSIHKPSLYIIIAVALAFAGLAIFQTGRNIGEREGDARAALAVHKAEIIAEHRNSLTAACVPCDAVKVAKATKRGRR